MTDAELLAQVKTALFGSPAGTYRDALLTIYIQEVKAFMSDAGVSKATLDSSASVGCVVMGVSDLWNYEPGGTRFSEYFRQRVTQLSTPGASSAGGDGA